jgi:sugar phosphate isomerase/epimerase
MTLEAFVQRTAEMGLSGVELTDFYFPSTEDAYLMSLKRTVYLHGLDIPAVAVHNNFCQPDAAQRAEQVALVKRWIDVAFKLGAPCLRVFAGPVPEGHREEDAQAWAIASLKEGAAYAAPRGVLLALENHGGITATASQTLALLKAVDSPWVGLNLDTGNFLTDPYRQMEQAAPYAVSVHAKAHIDHTDRLEDIDYARVISILSRAGYKGYLSIEYISPEDPLTAVPRLATHLQRLIRQTNE